MTENNGNIQDNQFACQSSQTKYGKLFFHLFLIFPSFYIIYETLIFVHKLKPISKQSHINTNNNNIYK